MPTPIYLLLLLVTLTCTARANRTESAMNRFMGQARLKLPPCTKAGPMCKTCNTIFNCVANSNGGFDEVYGDYCSDSATNCLNGQCSTAAQPKCTSISEIEFPCSTPGVFANPGDCKRYVVCLPDSSSLTGYTANTIHCPPGKGFDIGDGYCTQTLTNSQCLGQPLTCPDVSETTYHFLEENPNVLVVCTGHSFNIFLRYPNQIDIRYYDEADYS